MIFNEPKSDIQPRMFVAEMLKDKIECDNYSELCEKAYKFVTNGIVTTPPCRNAYNEGKKDEYGALVWYIDINTLQELHELIEEVRNPVIISNEHIEIYDTYRE